MYEYDKCLLNFSSQKKVLTKTKPGSSSNKDPGMEYPSCPSVLSDISIGNCLTPPSKRQRTEYDSERTTGSENVHSPYKVNIIFAFLSFIVIKICLNSVDLGKVAQAVRK